MPTEHFLSVEYTFFSHAHGAFPMITPILSQETNFNCTHEHWCQKIQTYVQMNACPQAFTAALSVIASSLEQPRLPLIGKQLSKYFIDIILKHLKISPSRDHRLSIPATAHAHRCTDKCVLPTCHLFSPKWFSQGAVKTPGVGLGDSVWLKSSQVTLNDSLL